MRPRFHFAPASGWINDPHGIAVNDGQYHAFFQYVPGATVWSMACSWGHAVGPDLMSLTEVAPALTPGDGDDGAWTGCLVPSDPPRIFYTAADANRLDIGRVRVATAGDHDWVEWSKGPVVVEAPPDVELGAFRDPFVVRDGDGWLMLVGAGLTAGGGAVLAYRSADLERWEDDGIFLSGTGEAHGTGWECPQLVEIDGRWVLVYSVWRAHVGYDVRYAVGDLVSGGFEPKVWGVLSYGPGPYAPTVYRDAAQRACVTFWLRDVSGDGWAGAHSIPYRLGLHGDVLVATPHPDVSQYTVTAPDGVVPGAGFVSWSAREGQKLSIGNAVQLRCEDALVIRIENDEWRMPRGDDVRVVIDAGILEVASTAGVFAAPVPAAESLMITGDGQLAVCALQRP